MESNANFPAGDGKVQTDSLNSDLFIFEGPGDNPPRALPPNVPRDWPRPRPPASPPETPTSGKP
jgi:hypothetical protein